MLQIVKMYMVRIIVLIMAIGILSSCEKEEQFASVTINGIEYAEIKTAVNPISIINPSSMTIWENYNAALYYTNLKPLKDGYPSFRIDFWLSLDVNSVSEINKPYKIWGIKTTGEYDWQATVTRLKDNIPDGYDGILYCYKDEVSSTSLPLEGIFTLEKYDSDTGYYHGSYQLTNSSEMDETFVIKGSFKAIEDRTKITY